MENSVNIHEAKTHFSHLIRRVMGGETVIIARAGKPVAILRAYEAPVAQRVPGEDRGLVEISPDFDAPLPEFDL